MNQVTSIHTTSDPITWLEAERMLDGDLLVKMGVKRKKHPKLGLMAAFQYYRNEKPYAAKFRTIDKKFLSTKGVKRGLYNEDALKNDFDLPIVITEGEVDCISVIQVGFVRCVSMPDGWSAQGNKAEALIEQIELLKKSPYVIIAGDNDEAGESLPRTVSNLLEGHDCRWVEWPKGIKDPNDVLVKRGEKELAECLAKAKPIDPDGGLITAFSNLPPRSKRRVLKLPDKPFCRILALELSALSIFTGYPGHGKSTFAIWAAEKISKAENIRVGVMTLETHPHRLRDQLARINLERPWKDLTQEERTSLLADIDARWRIAHRTSGGVRQHHLGWLKDMIYMLANRDRCKLIIIDPWNEIEHLPEKGESMTLYTNVALSLIRQWAEELEIHICVVAHPQKPSQYVRSKGALPAPVGFDVSDSAGFNNKPAFGLTVHREVSKDGFSVVKLLVWKVRDALLYGVTVNATVQVDFNLWTQSYASLGEVVE